MRIALPERIARELRIVWLGLMLTCVTVPSVFANDFASASMGHFGALESAMDSLAMPGDWNQRASVNRTELFRFVGSFEGFCGQLTTVLENKQRARATRRAVSEVRRRLREFDIVRLAFTNQQLVPGARAGDAPAQELLNLADRQAKALEEMARGFVVNFNGLIPVPIGSSSEAMTFWRANQIAEFLPTVALAGASRSGTMTATIVQDYFFGVRTSVSTAVSGGDDLESVRVNAQNLLEAGGSLGVGGEYPLAYFGLQEHHDDRNAGAGSSKAFFDLALTAAPRVGLSHPNVGGIEGDFSASGDLGASVEVRLGTRNEDVLFKGGYRIAHVFANEALKQGLGVAGHFGYQQLTLRIDLLKQFAIGWSAPLDAPSTIKDALRGSVTLRFTPKR